MVDFASLASKLKSLSIEGVKKKLAEPLAIGDGVRSSYRIISIAGETLALSETGLDPSEKMYHNKDDFKRLYVPEELEDNQDDLEEILIRMFPLTSAQSKTEVLPPDDEDEFNLVRQSLYYRLALLRDEILNDSSNSVDIREKLSRFDRLNKLLESLESKFQKKRTQTYFAITTAASAPPSTQDPKIAMDDATVNDLLRKFGLILLQSQHQLPGFKFPVPPNQIVRQVQSVALSDEDGFLEEAKKQGPLQLSVQDVLNPDEKEKRLLKSLRNALLQKIEPLMESISHETIDNFNFDLFDEEKPFVKSVETFVESLFSVLVQFESDVNKARTLVDAMDERINALQEEKGDCEKQLAKLQANLTKATQTAGEAASRQTSDRRVFESGALKLRAEIDDKAAQIRILEAQLKAIQEQLRLKESAAEALAAVTPEVERLREDVRVKAETIAALEAKDGEVEPLRQRIAELESKESLSKEEQKSLSLAEAQLERVSGEKQALEDKLRDYDENLEQLQELVSRIPGPRPTEGASPFELLKQRILSALPPAYLIPSLLEIESDQSMYTCQFLEALLQLFQTYFDTEAGQELEGRLTEQLDLLQEGKSRKDLAQMLLVCLNYANGEDVPDIDSSASLFSGNQSIKELETKADGVFFKGQEEYREAVQALNVRLAGKDFSSYPVFFFLYLLALRDWVNCIDLSSRPGKCPIPERLKRPTLKCP